MKTKGKLSVEVTTLFEDGVVHMEVNNAELETDMLSIIPLIDKTIEMFIQSYLNVGFATDDIKRHINSSIDSNIEKLRKR